MEGALRNALTGEKTAAAAGPSLLDQFGGASRPGVKVVLAKPAEIQHQNPNSKEIPITKHQITRVGLV